MDNSKAVGIMEVIKEIKLTREKFKKVIIYINENKDINNSLSKLVKKNLTELITLWQNYKNKGFDYYFDMKEYHSYINKQFTDKILDSMWEDYIKSGLEFRAKILFLCH